MSSQFQLKSKPITSPSIVSLDRSWIPSITAIEQISYANPWSSKAISAEFDKELSVKAGILFGRELAGYSFNTLIEDEFHILNIAISPEYRRIGLAKGLLAFALDSATNSGASTACLEVRVSNTPAQALYQHFGFKVVGVRKEYYSDNREDALLLDLKLDPILQLTVYREILGNFDLNNPAD